MANTQNIACPKCGKALRVPSDRGELKVRCPSCATEFLFQPASTSVIPAAASARPPAIAPPSVSSDCGWASLILGAGLPLAFAAVLWSGFELSGWLEGLFGLALAFLGPALCIRGIKRMSGDSIAAGIFGGLGVYAGAIFAAAWLASFRPEGLPFDGTQHASTSETTHPTDATPRQSDGQASSSGKKPVEQSGVSAGQTAAQNPGGMRDVSREFRSIAPSVRVNPEYPAAAANLGIPGCCQAGVSWRQRDASLRYAVSCSHVVFEEAAIHALEAGQFRTLPPGNPDSQWRTTMRFDVDGKRANCPSPDNFRSMLTSASAPMLGQSRHLASTTIGGRVSELESSLRELEGARSACGPAPADVSTPRNLRTASESDLQAAEAANRRIRQWADCSRNELDRWRAQRQEIERRLIAGEVVVNHHERLSVLAKRESALSQQVNAAISAYNANVRSVNERSRLLAAKKKADRSRNSYERSEFADIRRLRRSPQYANCNCGDARAGLCGDPRVNCMSDKEAAESQRETDRLISQINRNALRSWTKAKDPSPNNHSNQNNSSDYNGPRVLLTATEREKPPEQEYRRLYLTTRFVGGHIGTLLSCEAQREKVHFYYGTRNYQEIGCECVMQVDLRHCSLNFAVDYYAEKVPQIQKKHDEARERHLLWLRTNQGQRSPPEPTGVVAR